MVSTTEGTTARTEDILTCYFLEPAIDHSEHENEDMARARSE